MMHRNYFIHRKECFNLGVLNKLLQKCNSFIESNTSIRNLPHRELNWDLWCVSVKSRRVSLRMLTKYDLFPSFPIVVPFSKPKYAKKAYHILSTKTISQTQQDPSTQDAKNFEQLISSIQCTIRFLFHVDEHYQRYSHYYFIANSCSKVDELLKL